MAPGGRPGLGLDDEGALTQGERLKTAAEDLDAVGRLLGKDLGADLPFFGSWNPFAPDPFGEYGGQRAFPPFARVWNDEVATLAGALREIRQKIGDGVVTTTATDVDTGHALQAIPSRLGDL
ncbi:hypothetical protein [Streptomyces sp. JJ36]|uniref:hypothetical protein n=1 Tax=Streptomyces sp. JJ36 TaxID=2736645 RepID=UPI001F30F2EF|nr:hypothetical protein [Streptomyces sp. JJ36]MCF6524033.1 hypothetical protein [Streptomyces sp. JJ36]